MIEIRNKQGKLIAVRLDPIEQRDLARRNIELLKAQKKDKVH